MPNLQEIKARRGKVKGTVWKAVDGNANDIRSSVFVDGELLATISSWKGHYAEFIANAPTDIDWLVQEVARLREALNWFKEREVKVYDFASPCQCEDDFFTDEATPCGECPEMFCNKFNFRGSGQCWVEHALKCANNKEHPNDHD